MTLILLILIALTASLRLAALPAREIIVMAIAWGLVAAFLIFDASESTNIGSTTALSPNILAAIFIDSAIILAAASSPSATRLRFYPGLMLWLPLRHLAARLLIATPGIDFTLAAIVFGSLAAIIILLVPFILRRITPTILPSFTIAAAALTILIAIVVAGS